MSGIIHNLGINWKIFVAQLINFFILLFVLIKFVYQPILKIVNQRRDEIEKFKKETDVLREKMENFNQFEKTRMAEVEKKSNDIIENSKTVAREKQLEIIKQGKEEANRIIEKAKKIIQEEQNKIIDKVTPKINQLIILSLEKIISEKMSSEKDKEMIKKAISQSRDLIKK